MNKKNGFTLIEILCVIAIIGLLSTFIASSITKLSDTSKKELYCNKLNLIKIAAKEYGEKYENVLNESLNTYNGYKSITITVEDLITNNNIDPDKDNSLINPLDNTSLNNLKIIIYLKNNSIYVYIDDKDIC